MAFSAVASMALLRTTPATALPAVRQIAADLARWVKEAGPIAATQTLGEALDSLQSYCTDTQIAVDVMMDPATAPELRAGIEAFLEGSTADRMEGRSFGGIPLRVEWLMPGRRSVQRVGVPRAPVLVCTITSAERTESFWAELAHALEDHPVIVLIGAHAPALAAVRIVAGPSSIEAIEADRLAETTLARLLGGPKYAGVLHLIRADVAARALETLASASSVAPRQLAQSLRRRRCSKVVSRTTRAPLPAHCHSRSLQLRVFRFPARGMKPRSAGSKSISPTITARSAEGLTLTRASRLRRARAPQRRWHGDALQSPQRVSYRHRGQLDVQQRLFE